MNFKITLFSLFVTAGAVAEPVVLRGVKELHKGVELPGSSQPRPMTLAGKSSKAECSARREVVAVTNTHIVTAAIQQDAHPSSSSSSAVIIKDTISGDSKRSSTVSVTSNRDRVKRDSTVTSSTRSALASSGMMTGVKETTSRDIQRPAATSTRGSSAIAGQKSSPVSSASPSLVTGSSSTFAVNSTTSIDLDRSSSVLVERSSTAVANKETSLSSLNSILEIRASSRTIANDENASIDVGSPATTSNLSSTFSIADKRTSIASTTSTSTRVTVKAGSISVNASTTEISNSVPSINPTDPFPVSRAGDTLNPSAAAEAHEFDDTATRPLESVNIKASDGRCLSIDPTAGDFRQNLIPVSLVECSEAPNQKFDIVTRGKHNDDKAGEALLVSVLTNGCISFDGRRQAGDTVTLFSCGGRAAGDGKTDAAQLYPFDGKDSIVLSPASGNGDTCLVSGVERLESASCTRIGDQIFQLVEVL